ncbi:hypothetical protein [Dyadobacter chenhuakuii]|jgi:hypothetical protein|uniref:Uncharacterized protein n=1 Tax=Dyadobacter chenhuakuii TaxID=2909339 RepID=A0A9X1TRV8_9BACT|nr:hypothetical protein [Dyadobacter chenhuakuii]MCF2496673.1 hypothetical protein [Dyadobacter chenhuakuii]
MKTTFLMRITLLLFVLAISFACNKENNIAPEPDNGLLVQTNRDEYQKLMAARETFDGTPFEIKNIDRTGNTLKIQVTGAGGIENYKVVWDGSLMLSYPVQARLVVGYDAPDGVQDAMLHDYTLEVDLQKLFGSTANASEVIVHVSNGSKKQDTTVDPNGSTSNPK